MKQESCVPCQKKKKANKHRLPGRQLEDKEESRCRTCARIVTVSRWKTTFGESLEGRKHTNWLCAICGEKHDWKQPNRLLMVQTGESVYQAKVFKAHAVPQGQCGNLINGWKLLANQQKDGDSLIQNIVTNLGVRGAEKGLTEGLENSYKLTINVPLKFDSSTGVWEHF